MRKPRGLSAPDVGQNDVFLLQTSKTLPAPLMMSLGKDGGTHHLEEGNLKEKRPFLFHGEKEVIT